MKNGWKCLWKYLAGFFRELSPESMMRLMCFIVTCTACVILLIEVLQHRATVDWYGCVAMLGVAFGAKGIQKNMENKVTNLQNQNKDGGKAD